MVERFQVSKIANRIADELELYGFDRRSCKRFTEDGQAGYEIASIVVRPHERFSVYVYTAAYFGEKNMFWVGFGAPKRDSLHPVIEQLNKPIEIKQSEWSGQLDIDDDVKRKRILTKQPYVLEDYTSYRRGYWAWIGKYLRMDASSDSKANAAILDLLDFAAPALNETSDIDDSTPTQKPASVQIRTAQSKFKKKLLTRAGGRCEVTGSRVRGLLKASHIVGWSRATDGERRDPDNGLLLVAPLDAVFDRGFISFDSKGRAIVSPLLSARERKNAGVSDLSGLRKKPSLAQQEYLARHRTWFRRRLMPQR